MFRSLLVLLALIFLDQQNVHAQSPPGGPAPAFAGSNAEINTTFRTAMNNVFGNLDKSRIPFGILRDYGMEFTNLENFSGTAVLADSNYADAGIFWDVYNTLQTSKIHTSASGFLVSDTVENRWHRYRQPGRITLSGLFFKYSRLANNAPSNLTITSNQLFDKFVNGIWQNPYQSENVFVMSPSISAYDALSFQVLLPADLWMTNSSATVTAMAIDLGDGLGYRALTAGTPLAVTYATAGAKVWKYRLTLTGGQFLYGHSRVDVSGVSGAGARFGTQQYERIAIAATESYLGDFGRGTITIRYANPDLGLRRPLIVAEGFDPGHILKPESQHGIQGINDFEDDLEDDNLGLFNLIDNDVTGFDIVYVDWKNGTDYLQRNALLLEQVIRWVNANKEPVAGGGIARNVVMGISMGGVIARYALRDMENKGQVHQTSLYISYDAPHQGANVPQGFQHLARHARDLYIQTGATASTIELHQLIHGGMSPMRALSIANEPASRQMLINYVNDLNAIDNTVHNTWQTELANMGYPQGNGGIALRRVAASNGSECADPLFAAGSTLFSYQGKGRTTFLADLGVSGIVLSTAATLFNQPAFLLGTMPGRNDFKLDFAVNAKADGSANQVYKGAITYTKWIMWVIPVNVPITNRTFNSQAATLPYDGFPGGFYQLGMEINSASSNNYWTRYNISAYSRDVFSFIPTPSALDIGGSSNGLVKSDYLVRYVATAPPAAPKQTPFHSFTTSFSSLSMTNMARNEEHPYIFNRTSEWLRGEIAGTPVPVNCTALCGTVPMQITGPAGFCNTGTYALSNIPANMTVQWSLASGIGTLSCSQCPQTTITSSSNHIMTISATLNGCQFSRSLVRQVGVGTIAPSRLGIYGDGNTGPWSGNYFPQMGAASYAALVDGEELHFQSVPVEEFEWAVGTGLQDLQYNAGMGYSLPPFVDGKGVTIRWNNLGYSYGSQVRIRARNACGWGDFTDLYWVNVSSSPGLFKYTMSPNPANGVVNIGLKETETVAESRPAATSNARSAKAPQPVPQAKPDVRQIRLFDSSGALKKQWRYGQGSARVQFDVTGLPSGVYFAEITTSDNQVEKQKLIITR